MEQINKFKEQSQAGLKRLREVGENQPEDVKLWGVTAGTAVVGGVVVAAVAKGLVAVLATLANPAVALTIGAVAGGAFGWSYMQSHIKQEDEPTVAEDVAAPDTPVSQTPAAS